MELQLANAKKGSTVQVSDSAFAREFNEGLVHQVVTAYLAGARAGTRGQKTRAAVRGGGAKPWRQKGTGNARAGSIRSPLWRGGGKTFAAKPQDHAQKVNKKMYRAAMRAIFSELVRQHRLVVVEELAPNSPKTRDLLAELASAAGGEVGRLTLIVKDAGENVFLAARNVPSIDVVDATEIDPAGLVGSDKVLLTVPALKAVEEWLG